MPELNLSFDLPASEILAASPERFAQMRRAGVETLYVQGWFFGKYEDDPERISRAGRRVREEGFRTGVVNVPFGHGGNAVNPDDPNFDLSIGDGWRPTFDAEGRLRPNTTCPDATVAADTLAANRAFAQMGFDAVFHDDDLRLGSWGPQIQGCFCERCMAEFRALCGWNVSRAEIVSGRDEALTELWYGYQCGKIRDFLLAGTPEGMSVGIMVMHNGDRRHGIDIPLLRAALPGLRVRVGEGHFDDRTFTDEKGRASLIRSIRRHMALTGDPGLCWSETTCYPKYALSPDNLVEKMRVEIRCGLRNLFLMSGQWFFPEEYWRAVEQALPELRDLARSTPLPPPEKPEFTWDW